MVVADCGAVAIDAFAGLDRFGQTPQPVLTESDVPARGIDLPLVAGAFEQPNGLGQLVDRLLEPRRGIQHDAVEAERLTLPPHVAERAADLQ
jgi:hypothetical protein